jgi:hypothetical protein
MPAKGKPPAGTLIRDVTKTLHEDDIVRLDVHYKWQKFRYLFDGGATVDVVAIQDDSDLRSWVLTVTGYPGIVGCTIVEGSDE